MDDEEFKCGTCGLWFCSWDSRKDHLWLFEHAAPEFECESCERFFPTLQQVENHMDSKGHWAEYEFGCHDCNRGFGSFNAREQHMRALGHQKSPNFECDTCGVVFPSQQILDNHMDARNHRVEVEEIDSDDLEYTFEYWCGLCTRYFETEEDRTKHEAQAHYHCGECEIYFQNANNAWMHQNSKRHRGTPIRCPFCREYYSAATALCHHLERGACSAMPDLTREQIFQLVRSKDPNGIISKENIDLRCIITSGYWSNEDVYKVANKPWLYQEDLYLYHCPNNKCDKNFTTLAGVMNHLESESCGFTRFVNVQRSAENIVSGNRMISFH
ncbi:uncharacterized protein PG998_003682 [Apiospora kogelbergensis]|uniref:C2H2-type domain-containing protein n=1 Tax=Apiospora kogelbergensis TaxID=1337665 RepID=A0AAW0QTE9_9PEZI